jgi:hypothetical protein
VRVDQDGNIVYTEYGNSTRKMEFLDRFIVGKLRDHLEISDVDEELLNL